MRITHTCHNLRTPDWDRVDYRQLRDRIVEDNRSGDDRWTVVQWQRHIFGTQSFLFLSEGGAIYALFLKRSSHGSQD